MQLSPSKINDITICTAKYYYGRILKLPRRKTFITEYGSIIDKTIEHMLQDKMGGSIYGFGVYTDIAKELMNGALAKGIEMDQPTRDEEWYKISSVLKMYYESELPIVKPLFTQFVNKYDADLFRVYQIFDLIAEGPVVIDYKAPIKRFEKVKGVYHPKSFGHVIQLYCYYYGYYAAFGEYPVGLELHYLMPPKKMVRSVKPAEIVKVPVVFPVVEDDAEFMIRDAYEKIVAVEAGKYLPNRVRTNYLCSRKWCDYWETCEEEFGEGVRQ